MTWKKRDDSTGYNEEVYNRELGELMSFLQGSEDLNCLTQSHPGPSSLLNPEIVLSEEKFQAAHEDTKGWTVETWMCGGEVPNKYEHDRLKARLDWCGKPAELKRIQDEIDEIDHEAMYSDVEYDDPPANMPDLEETDSVNTSVYDRLGATPASTAISTNTEAASDMLHLTMGQSELLTHQEAHDLVDDSDPDDNPLADMFKVPAEVPVFRAPLPAKPQLDPWVLMVEAKYKSGCRTLPPPPGLKRHIDNPDSRSQNIVLRAIQMPMVTNTPVEVANPQNTDLLDLDQDTSRDKALQVMKEERHR